MSVPEQWQRPRTGQMVQLRAGKVASVDIGPVEVEVVAVRRCNDILRTLSEDKAKIMGARLTASYGKTWQSIYYEADGVRRGRLVTFEPNDVHKILDTRI